ncbi:hypothetical protein [Flavobacterium sp. JLP]|uniref:hypothetical protein n=1 Tax=Flavobacterium sp. JLP TaxID=2783793 RepID=UPI001E29FFC8|nr:hypothetical protein [Flavobacterium sp. JLP]
MKTDKIFSLQGIAILIFIALVMPITVTAQIKGIKRTDLQKHDISVTGKETVQARIDFEPHVALVNIRIPAKKSFMF